VSDSRPFALTARWTPLRYHPEQHRLWTSTARFVVVPAGRRSGKTELGKRRIIKAAMRGTRFDNARFFAAAPTYAQAKRIFWDDLKALTPPALLACKPSESELVIQYINGSEVHVIGMDKPERVEGSPWDGCELTEVANMKQNAWPANIRPALADRQGWAVLEGVPEGRNHYYELDQKARADTSGEWAAFHWKSAEILPASEIEAAKRDLDELTFQQEYEASFLNFHGRCYYPFDTRVHCAKLHYDPKQPLIFTFDFNIAPGTAAVLQEMKLPNGLPGTGIIGEVYIPRNSNTNAVCDKLLSQWGTHPGKVRCYGDATGGAGGTAKVAGSDWDLIQRKMRERFKDLVRFNVPDANPRERVRVNAVNTRLMNGAGEVHMMIDPAKAPFTVRDFDGVRLLEGGSGEIDKMDNPDLTHLTDGIGYYIAEEFPVESRTAYTARVIGV
jgi:hypothetical protein